MIGDEEVGPLTEDDEAFFDQWLKLWFSATSALKSAGWEPERGLHTDLWSPPAGVPRATWAAACLRHDVEEALEIRERSADPFVKDAAAAMLSLWSIAEGIAEAGEHKAQARKAALWGINAATYMVRSHPGSPYARIAASSSCELRRVRAALEPHLELKGKQSQQGVLSGQKRSEKWHPRAKEIAREELARRPRASNDSLATLISLKALDEPGFNPPSQRRVATVVASWRGEPNGIPDHPRKNHDR